ncbi:hypothetical protein AaE_013054 [Aphanomyces astaci]|uniref:DDE Tnp4 domain-containing protein n=1 Tax=Aphanomyces astaci TaxID=112090 RepID=A0A6A4ZE90_APHAT|nr:hypothetical protein AaE_013054 [Aphanomyces astaci]
MIHPKRRPVNGALDASDVQRNRLISSDRVIVENYFGRVCALWKASYATFTWSEKNYCAIQRTTFALTNYHLNRQERAALDLGRATRSRLY